MYKINHFQKNNNKFHFRSLLLGFFEMFFGRTLFWNDNKTEYYAKKTMGRIIRERNVPAERLGVLLNPQFHSMNFTDLKDLIDGAIDYLNKQTDINDVSDRIAFLNGLKEIINQYVAEEQPHKKAMEDFKKLVALQAPVQYKRHMAPLVEVFFKEENFNLRLVSRCKIKSKCFTGWMDNKASKAFWSHEHCFKDDTIELYGTNILGITRNIIVKFFGKD